MYHVSVQGVDERTINVHYIIIKIFIHLLLLLHHNGTRDIEKDCRLFGIA